MNDARVLHGTSYINALLAIVSGKVQPLTDASVKIACEDILAYVQRLEDIAVKLAIRICVDEQNEHTM